MHIYHIQSLSGHVKHGISNHDYKITGVKRLRIWPNDHQPLSIIVSEELIERHGRRRFIEMKEGEIERVGADVFLNTTHQKQNGAIVFWDFSGFKEKVDKKLKSSRIDRIGYPTSIETKNAEVILKHQGRYCDTVLCLLYQGGAAKAIYDNSGYVALGYEDDFLAVDTG